MQNKAYLLLFLAVSLLLSACNQHYFYAPNTLHLPTVKEKGEATIEASLNGSQQIKGTELRAAYCFAPKTSAMVNFMYMKGSFSRSFFGSFPPPPPEQHSGRGYLTEIGVTRHFPLSKYTDFTLTAGGGIGQSVNDYDRGRTATLNFNRLFLQPGLVTKGELAEFGIGLRFSRLGFQSASIDYRIDDNDIFALQAIEKNTPFLIPDLGINTGINFAPFHVKCNMVFTLSDKPGTYNFTGNNLSVSVLYDINQFTKKDTTKRKKKKKK
jgi:hypothetical protein